MRNRSFRPGLEVLGLRITPTHMPPMPYTLVDTGEDNDPGMDFSGTTGTPNVPIFTSTPTYPYDEPPVPIIFGS